MTRLARGQPDRMQALQEYRSRLVSAVRGLRRRRDPGRGRGHLVPAGQDLSQGTEPPVRVVPSRTPGPRAGLGCSEEVAAILAGLDRTAFLLALARHGLESFRVDFGDPHRTKV